MSETSPLLQSSARSQPNRAREDVESSGSYTAQDDADLDQISVIRGLAISASIFILLFTSTCDISVLTTIQSPIAIDLDATTETSWFVSTFLIATSAVTPVAGKLTQVFTPRNYLTVSILVSAVGLLVTAFAPSLKLFIAGRALMGVGAAAFAPVGLIMITQYVSKKRRGLFFGLVNCAYTTGLACGAIIGGALEPIIGWRAYFWIQAPILVLLSLVVFGTIPPSKAGLEGDGVDSNLSITEKLSSIDYLGMTTLIASVVLLLYSLSAPQLLLQPIFLSSGMFVLFVFVETYWAKHPIVPHTVLQSKGPVFTGLATIGLMSARWGVIFYVPTYAIAVRQWSPTRAGVLLIPTNAGFGLGGVVVGWLHIRRAGSFYIPSLVSFVLFAATQFTFGFLTEPNSPVVAYITLLFLNGFFAGAILNYTLAHLLHLTEPKHHVIVLPLLTMFRGLAGAFGSSISGGVFLRSLQKFLTQGFREAGLSDKTELIQQLLGRPLLVQKLDPLEKGIAIASYSCSLQDLYFVGGVLVLAMIMLQAGTGWTAPEPTGVKRTESESSLVNGNTVAAEPIAA